MKSKDSKFFWKALNSISNGRNPIPRDQFQEKEYQSFMIMKWLSMDLSLGPTLKWYNNKEARTADPYSHYLALFRSVSKKYRNFFKDFGFAKKGSEKYPKETISAAQVYFKVRYDIAEEYLDCMDSDEVSEFCEYCKKTGIVE